jgi:uncharacterized paraquat-inducible protein A
MKGRGYLMIDHRGAGGRLEEYDTEQCPHCERIFRVVKTTVHREAFCAPCGKRVCPRPACGDHRPHFMARLVGAMERAARREQLDILMAGGR